MTDQSPPQIESPPQELEALYVQVEDNYLATGAKLVSMMLILDGKRYSLSRLGDRWWGMGYHVCRPQNNVGDERNFAMNVRNVMALVRRFNLELLYNLHS